MKNKGIFNNFMKSIFKKVLIIGCFFGLACLSGCTSSTLKAPCPDFGSQCDKTPINSWNSNY